MADFSRLGIAQKFLVHLLSPGGARPIQRKRCFVGAARHVNLSEAIWMIT